MSQCQGQISLFSAEAFHDLANHLVLPGSKEARKMTAISGQKWLGLSKNFGPLGLLEKMLLESSEWHSPIYYLNWKPVDIGQGHFLFRLVLSEPDTGDTELRLWPTPKASLRGDCPSERNRRSPDLAAAVKMYNTPTAQDAKNSTLPRSQIKRDSLIGNVLREQAFFPTPTTGAGMCGGTGNFQQLKKLKEQGVISEDERRSMSQGNGGQLNPYWVEWLQGFPIGWTEI